MTDKKSAARISTTTGKRLPGKKELVRMKEKAERQLELIKSQMQEWIPFKETV